MIPAIIRLMSGWKKKLLASLSITSKIGYGYGLAIGIGVFGTGIGLFVGDFSQRRAQEQLQIAEAQDRLINELILLTLI
ncbi:MAG: hypothetical protein F6K24_48065, partial [Okeania sp. SIO2D1]|nr:hypothetical protein [Okeania sp. SIO2D1]